MGADLCAFIQIGPDQVTDEDKVLAAIEHAREVCDIAREVVAELDSSDADLDEQDLPDELGHIANASDVFQIVDIDCEKTVRDFVEFWNTCQARDTTFRYHTAGTKIVVSGERTWGDEPDGVGYQRIKMAHLLGFLSVLGID